VLIFHGYLLRGTGSNVYNAELARALARLGHEVHLLCQDRDAADLPWVREPEGEGSITIHVPEIGGLLPVYVHDHYEGFEVKTYPELSDAELRRYLERNVDAVGEVVAGCGEPGAALANHLVMAPAILARAGLRFAAKIHGSDLSYTVRPHRERFLSFAREGIEAASAALVGSRHTAEDLWETVALPGLEDRTRLGPPGVDVRAFRPLPAPDAEAGLRRLAGELARAPAEGLGRDPKAAARAVEWFADAPAERVLFVGKFLVNKGADLLLAAWPLVVHEHPRARLLLTGFGAFEDGLRRLWAALEQGDLEAASQLARRGRALEGEGKDGALALLIEFLARPPGDYADACRAATGSIAISGRLEHAEVAVLCPAVDSLVMPSTFPEAFGMVAAEAAASGALPISAAHSGMAEVSRQLATSVDPDIGRLLSFPLEQDPVRGIAERLVAWLAIDPARRREIGALLSHRVGELWSWERVAAGVIAAARGDLHDLPRP
jgi:glycosyltransferase involved in cell wall biosynthesis